MGTLKWTCSSYVVFAGIVSVSVRGEYRIQLPIPEIETLNIYSTADWKRNNNNNEKNQNTGRKLAIHITHMDCCICICIRFKCTGIQNIKWKFLITISNCTTRERNNNNEFCSSSIHIEGFFQITLYALKWSKFEKRQRNR